MSTMIPVWVMRDYPEAKVYLSQEDEADAARSQAIRFSTRTSPHTDANDFKPLCEVLCPKPPFAEPALKEWDAKDQELADSAAKADSENIQIGSAFDRISAEAEAVEWVNPNLGATTRSGRTVKPNSKMSGVWHQPRKFTTSNS